ncbi:hypothetical protein PUNSTDRAFT_120948 [Punctularia strigosozonata HHB-11173 SS5]|uniref:uncharacterized protein n=1 Tax=Punctularia strigosozonata (strain HHB-11173) TaxID=741275 RepID=UPI0004417AC1|nr:uncharacterized protein PUNSTDRAFT_120948 [Punctularia strigosozonata HHB-11173 SS5]EIN07638.1 hypothetical protein PUNSTDRAFT_120948 [Punctularia strigosozonata HHB-11173 SS5]
MTPHNEPQMLQATTTEIAYCLSSRQHGAFLPTALHRTALLSRESHHVRTTDFPEEAPAVMGRHTAFENREGVADLHPPIRTLASASITPSGVLRLRVDDEAGLHDGIWPKNRSAHHCHCMGQFRAMSCYGGPPIKRRHQEGAMITRSVVHGTTSSI